MTEEYKIMELLELLANCWTGKQRIYLE